MLGEEVGVVVMVVVGGWELGGGGRWGRRRLETFPTNRSLAVTAVIGLFIAVGDQGSETLT